MLLDLRVLTCFSGISHAYGGALSALSITYSLTPAPEVDGEERWNEKEVVVAVYEDRQEVLAVDERIVSGPL